MADTRYFTQEFNGTPAAQLTLVQPSGTTKYLPYGEDKTVYIGSSDTIISVTSTEIADDTGAIFSKVNAALLGSHYPVISVDTSAGKEVYTYTGSATKSSAGKTTGSFYFIAQINDTTKYLEVTDTGCKFTTESGLAVIATTISAIEGGTSRLFTSVNAVSGKCTIAVNRSIGKVTNIEYFSLYSFTSNNGVPTYKFMSQSNWLTVTPSGDSISAISTATELVYVPWNGIDASDIASVYQTVVNALNNQQWVIFYTVSQSSFTDNAYWSLVEFGPGVLVFNRIYNDTLYTLTINSDGTATQTSKTIGGGSYTAQAPLHISDTGEIYMDPVSASPLSEITTPSFDILVSYAPAAAGGGHGNQWCSMDGHLFTVPNYFAIVDTDIFKYIIVQPQPSAVTTHCLGVYELDATTNQLHLCCLSKNAASLADSAGQKTIGVDYIDSAYGTIKPNKMYYACHFCDQGSLLVAGYTGNTFNLNPSSSPIPLGITKTNISSVNSDGSIPINNIKTLALNTFGMTAERHLLALDHTV